MVSGDMDGATTHIYIYIYRKIVPVVPLGGLASLANKSYVPRAWGFAIRENACANEYVMESIGKTAKQDEDLYAITWFLENP